MSYIQRDPILANPSQPRLYSSAQTKLGAAFSAFSQQATDFHTIASFSLAGMIGQSARLAFLNSPLLQGSLFRPLAGHLGGLFAESAALTLLQHPQNPKPYAEAFRSHLLNLTALRLSGHLFHSSNLFIRHSLSNFGMMAGHHLAVAVAWESSSPHSFAEEFFNAEIMTLQFEAGNSLGHFILGHRISHLQRQLEQGIATHSNSISHSFSPLPRMASQKALRNLKYHPNFATCWASLSCTLRPRVLRALEAIAQNNPTKGMDAKKLKGVSGQLMQARLNGQFRILFVVRDRNLEFIHVGAHNETDRVIRQWRINPMPESHFSDFDPFATKAIEGETPQAENAISGSRSPEEWTEHWLRYDEDKRARPTPVPDEGIEIEEARTALADPSAALRGIIEARLLSEFLELEQVTNDEVIATSEASLWRGDPEARTLFHSQVICQKLARATELREETRAALGDISEILGASAASDGVRDITDLVLNEYRKIHPLDRFRLGDPARLALSNAELEKTCTEALLSCRWSDESLGNILDLFERNPENPIPGLVTWALSHPARPLRVRPAEQERFEIVTQTFPELEYAANVENTPFTDGERASLGIQDAASIRFWNECEPTFRRIVRSYQRFLGKNFSTSHFAVALRHASAWARQGAEHPALLSYTWKLLKRARTLEDKALKNSMQTQAMLYIDGCQEIIESPHRIAVNQAPQVDLQRFFGARNATFTALLIQLARHPEQGRALSDHVWNASPSEELEGAAMQRVIDQLHQKAAEIYLKYRARILADPLDVLGNPLLDPQENIPTALGIPDEFPEVNAFSLKELHGKVGNIRIVLREHDPASTPYLVEHARKNGVIRESLLDEAGWEEFRSHPAEVAFTINGRTEARGEILSARPYSPTYRMSLLLLCMLGPDLHRIVLMGLNFDHSFRATARKLASQAANLIMAGAPNAWVVTQFATRYLAAYRTHRQEIFREISRKCPSFKRDVLFRMPEYDLLRENLAAIVMLENEMDAANPANRDVLKILKDIFPKYESYSAAPAEQTDQLANEITDGIASALVEHHPCFRNMFGLPEDLRIFMNTFSLIVKEEEMPELFRDNAHLSRHVNNIRVPAPISRESEMGKMYIRALIFLQMIVEMERAPWVSDFVNGELQAISAEQHPVYTALATLKFYFIHREKIVAELQDLFQ